MQSNSRDIHIIYASTSGNVEAVVEKIAATLPEYKFTGILHRAEQTSPAVINDNKAFIFATSTWEHGEINPFFNKLLAEIPKVNCDGKIAGFIGLGDKRYEPVLFCEGIETLRRALITQGMDQVFETLKIDGEPYDLLDTVVKNWAYDFIYTLKEVYDK